MLRKKIKIAYVNQPLDRAIPPVQRASIAILTYQVARRMAAFHDVVVYASRSLRENKALSHGGVHYRYFPLTFDSRLLKYSGKLAKVIDGGQPFFNSSLYYLGYIFQVACHLKMQKCEIVHLHNYSQFVPIIRTINSDIKIVLHMNSEWLTQLNEETIASRLNKTDLIIGSSDFITNKIRQRYPESAEICRTIYNGVDANYFTPGSDSFRKPGIRLLYVGRLSPEKGVHVLLESLPDIIERYPRAQLEIIGPEAVPPLEFFSSFDNGCCGRIIPAKLLVYFEGSYLAHLKKLTAHLNLSDKVKFVGPVPQESLLDYYHRADVLVAPSVWEEPFGMMNIEAMACGLPVVATDGGGIPEIVEHGKTGLLVERDNPKGLAKAILDILENKELRKSMGKAARQRVVQRFSWKKVTDDLADLYEEL